MSELNGHSPRFQFPPARSAEPTIGDGLRHECRLDFACGEGVAEHTAAILADPAHAERFRRLSGYEQVALRQASHNALCDAVKLHHRILDALGLPRDTTAL